MLCKKPRRRAGEYVVCLLLVFFIPAFSVFSEDSREEINLKDTLFEKTIWHKKVSHILLEETSGSHRVSLLMIIPYPHNYKSQNYAIYYEYENLKEALEKLHWLDHFLKSNGVLRVKINGSKIVSEKIIFIEDTSDKLSSKTAAEAR